MSTDPEHKLAMEAVGFAAQLLTPQAEVLAALVRAEREMHSHLHITDPTLYREALGSRSLQQQVKQARAALAFILAVQEVKSELEAEGGR
jgi:hypothetical protein